MKIFGFSPLSILFIPFLLSWSSLNDQWFSDDHQAYRLFYTPADDHHKDEYAVLIENGMTTVTGFFQSNFQETFDVFIHPDRKSLDSTWQVDWKMPEFKSECWMVASGVASRLDLISPAAWNTEACEHDYANSLKTQRLITHELVHVFHGQKNRSPDFSDVTGMDWFIEGLATYASGQCDSARIAEVRKIIFENKAPGDLDEFWVGKLKYGLSGTMVMYMDQKFGREKLVGLLHENRLDDLLNKLNVNEQDLMNGWKSYMGSLTP